MEAVVHFLLAISLFLIQNYIGSRSYSKGYIKFSLLDEKDETVSTNFVIKVFGPIIFIILSASLFQYFNLNRFVPNVINVVYYYIFIRIFFIVIYERVLIINWFRTLIHFSAIVLVSNIINDKLIKSVSVLLPDFSTIKNELWLLVIIFLYQVGNGTVEKFSDNNLSEQTKAYLPELKKRKRKYILKKYKDFNKEYEKIIKQISKEDNAFDLLVISILIFENFNRPFILRYIERIYCFLFRKTITQGIMQISSNKVISDTESVKIGTDNLFNVYKEIKSEQNIYNPYRRTIKRHCPDKKYIRQILFIAKAIIDAESDRGKYSEIFEEIKSEFDLYDYY